MSDDRPDLEVRVTNGWKEEEGEFPILGAVALWSKDERNLFFAFSLLGFTLVIVIYLGRRA